MIEYPESFRTNKELDNCDPLGLIPSACSVPQQYYAHAESEERPVPVRPARLPIVWDSNAVIVPTHQTFCEVYTRMRYLSNCHDAQTLGNFLQINPARFLHAYRSFRIPARWLVHICLCSDNSPNWILNIPTTSLIPYEAVIAPKLEYGGAERSH